METVEVEVTEDSEKKQRGITEAQLTEIESMGKVFADGVKVVRARLADVDALKESVKAARKEANTAFRRLKSAVKKVTNLTA